MILLSYQALNSIDILICEKLCPPITPLAEAAPYFCQHSLLVVEFLPQRPRARISSSESKHKTKLNLSEAVQIKKKKPPTTPKLAMY